jgi:hypothetical protein
MMARRPLAQWYIVRRCGGAPLLGETKGSRWRSHLPLNGSAPISERRTHRCSSGSIGNGTGSSNSVPSTSSPSTLCLFRNRAKPDWLDLGLEYHRTGCDQSGGSRGDEYGCALARQFDDTVRSIPTAARCRFGVRCGRAAALRSSASPLKQAIARRSKLPTNSPQERELSVKFWYCQSAEGSEEITSRDLLLKRGN